jgi:hypothetical protein
MVLVLEVVVTVAAVEASGVGTVAARPALILAPTRLRTLHQKSAVLLLVVVVPVQMI